MQRLQAGAGGPVLELIGDMAPQPLRKLLGSAQDAAVAVVGIGVDHAQDLEDRVREVGVPAAGAEADLAEGLAVGEAGLAEGLGLGDEAVEGLLVHARQQPVPDLLDPGGVAVADGVLHLLGLGVVVDRRLPRAGHLVEELGQLIGRAGVVRLTAQLDHRGGSDVRERVREGLGLQAHQVDVVVEGASGDREAHAAQIGDDLGSGVEARGLQATADLAGLVDHRAQAELHQLVGRDEPGEPRADHGDLGAVHGLGHLAQARGVLQVVVVAEREVGVQHGQQAVLAAVHGVLGGSGHRDSPSWSRRWWTLSWSRRLGAPMGEGPSAAA